MTLLLGCIADDFTGATDLAGMLVRAGMRTVQMIGVPTTPLPRDVDAVVIALKSRTTPPREAVEESLAALQWLRDAGCRQFYFKYCSTFDSTDVGNIGPVTDALMTALDTRFTIACPAFPENKRTIFKGHLFVGDQLLSDSGMRHHPLTPMTDSNLVRVLQRQTARKVGLIGHEAIGGGKEAIEKRIRQLQDEGVEIAIVDAISNDDLMQIGAACADLPLLTAGSGIALGLPQNFRAWGLLDTQSAADALTYPAGLRAVISGSCSVATQAQVAHFINAGRPAFAVDPLRLAAGEDVVAEALEWATPLLADGPPLIYATASPARVKAAQESIGIERAGALVEEALSAITQGLVERGVRQLVVAGGETSGAVVQALNVTGLHIGPQIDPGVPWTTSIGERPLALALKSGNFGTTDFFTKAWSMLR
ncbi:four-carbon acid sugar kinase family protein [Noviherbaspirillum cavernae]|uniref:3-oxo-tetronate kinase n=1 Tax=Noviherbaspirillum cavernae TaxID=2320862 RepID=A0A418WVB4_9BURK|nr:3-oxo-tetronate kinase [Noviherbaspirillum cavernae]RJF96617.1 four-carbon acid sugar kinase family protein [Noviherbaspirillum cavernae]